MRLAGFWVLARRKLLAENQLSNYYGNFVRMITFPKGNIVKMITVAK